MVYKSRSWWYRSGKQTTAQIDLTILRPGTRFPDCLPKLYGPYFERLVLVAVFLIPQDELRSSSCIVAQFRLQRGDRLASAHPPLTVSAQLGLLPEIEAVAARDHGSSPLSLILCRGEWPQVLALWRSCRLSI